MLRYRYDVNRHFTIGALGTSRDGTGYRNRVAGIDADIRLTPRDRIVAQILASKTRYPDEVVADFEQPEGRSTTSPAR